MAWLSLLKWGSKLVMTGLAFKEAKDLDDSMGGHVQDKFWDVTVGAGKGAANAAFGRDAENDTPNQAKVRAAVNGDISPLIDLKNEALSGLGLGSVNAQTPFEASAGQPVNAGPASDNVNVFAKGMEWVSDNKANTAGAVAAGAAGLKATSKFGMSGFSRIAMSLVLAIGLFIGMKGLLSNSFNAASSGETPELAMNNDKDASYDASAPSLSL